MDMGIRPGIGQILTRRGKVRSLRQYPLWRMEMEPGGRQKALLKEREENMRLF